jgi:hypothetical protein
MGRALASQIPTFEVPCPPINPERPAPAKDYLWVMIGFSDDGLSRSRSLWREKLKEAEARYTENRDEDNRAEYRRVLKVFTRLVVHDEQPD